MACRRYQCMFFYTGDRPALEFYFYTLTKHLLLNGCIGGAAVVACCELVLVL